MQKTDIFFFIISLTFSSSFSSAYGTLRANAACHTFLHRFLSPASFTRIVSYMVRRTFSTVSSHLYLGFPCGRFLFNFLYNISLNSLPYDLQTCPIHCIRLILTKATTLGCLNWFLKSSLCLIAYCWVVSLVSRCILLYYRGTCRG